LGSSRFPSTRCWIQRVQEPGSGPRNGDSGRDRGNEDSGDDGDDGDDSDDGDDGNPGGNPGGGGNGPGGTGGDTPGPSKGRSSKKTVTRGEALGLLTSKRNAKNCGANSVTNSTALGIHHRVGALSGYGIEALIQNATTITTTGVEFNPLTGELIHQDTSQAYRPPETMRRRIQARDQHCRAPGCARHAVFTDTDHVTAYQRGGPTTDTNLQCLCRHHHKMKQNGWQVVMNTAGVCTWTTPTGRTYTTEPGLLQTYRDAEGL
ncbi:HNH endonuclease signature motif containing protein, partial [Yimella lutea]|uniref:HNH endonuclease signature motif containing protein n=1 Tax=Yimella lutea TaxID=587872 RepID=UPI0031E6298C